MTAPVELSLVGRVAMSEISKESLLAFWQGVTETHQLNLRLGERMFLGGEIERSEAVSRPAVPRACSASSVRPVSSASTARSA